MNALRLFVSLVGVSAAVVLGVSCFDAIAGGAEPPKDLDQIPKVVRDSLLAKFPAAKIHKWTKESENGKDVYDIEFKLDGRKTEADIFADGAIQNFEEEVDVKDLPKAVRETVDKKFPGGKIKEAMKITEIKDNKETPGGFEVVLDTAAGKQVELTIAADGKVLEESPPPAGEKK